MKTNKLELLVLLLIMTLLSACFDVEVTTILNSDGSLDRIVEVHSNSELKNFDELPFPVDSSWQITYKVDSTIGDKNHLYIFKKHYKNVVELNEEYNNNPNKLGNFERNIEIEKKFRWFYTYISFKEKYKKQALGDYRPFNQYLSEIEKEIHKMNNKDTISETLNIDSKELKTLRSDIDNKFVKWLEDNLKQEILLAIEKDMKDYKVQNISLDDIKANQDTVFKLFDFFGENKIKNELYIILNKFFKTEEFNKIVNSENSSIIKLEEKLSSALGQKSFKYKLQIPGLLLNTNAESSIGNELSWQFEPLEAFFIENSHYAESRVINLWAFIVSGIFLLGVIILLLISGFKRSI